MNIINPIIVKTVFLLKSLSNCIFIKFLLNSYHHFYKNELGGGIVVFNHVNVNFIIPDTFSGKSPAAFDSSCCGPSLNSDK